MRRLSSGYNLTHVRSVASSGLSQRRMALYAAIWLGSEWSAGSRKRKGLKESLEIGLFKRRSWSPQHTPYVGGSNPQVRISQTRGEDLRNLRVCLYRFAWHLPPKAHKIPRIYSHDFRWCGFPIYNRNSRRCIIYRSVGTKENNYLFELWRQGQRQQRNVVIFYVWSG